MFSAHSFFHSFIRSFFHSFILLANVEKGRNDINDHTDHYSLAKQSGTGAPRRQSRCRSRRPGREEVWDHEPPLLLLSLSASALSISPPKPLLGCCCKAAVAHVRSVREALGLSPSTTKRSVNKTKPCEVQRGMSTWPTSHSTSRAQASAPIRTTPPGGCFLD